MWDREGYQQTYSHIRPYKNNHGYNGIIDNDKYICKKLFKTMKLIYLFRNLNK